MFADIRRPTATRASLRTLTAAQPMRTADAADAAGAGAARAHAARPPSAPRPAACRRHAARRRRSTAAPRLVVQDILALDAAAAGAGRGRARRARLRHARPVLVDVTPRALVVETVGGWCDVVVQRNAKIPCERTRAFTTSSDMQTVVRVRVAQGEDAVFEPEHLPRPGRALGPARRAPRARSPSRRASRSTRAGRSRCPRPTSRTGREAHATLQLVGIAGAQSVDADAGAPPRRPDSVTRAEASDGSIRSTDAPTQSRAWLDVARRAHVLRALRPRPATPTPTTIREAFHVFCDTFHPDRHFGRDATERDALSAPSSSAGTEAYLGALRRRACAAVRRAARPRAASAAPAAHLASRPLAPPAQPGPAGAARSRTRSASACRAAVRAPRRGADPQGRPAAGQAPARDGRPHGPGQRGPRQRARARLEAKLRLSPNDAAFLTPASSATGEWPARGRNLARDRTSLLRAARRDGGRRSSCEILFIFLAGAHRGAHGHRPEDLLLPRAQLVRACTSAPPPASSGSLGYLVRADRRARRASRAPGPRSPSSSAPSVLITGPLWGAKAWGTFWTWDPRLTTALLSFLIYVAYLVLRAFAGDGDGRAALRRRARRARRGEPAHHPLQRAEVGRAAPDGHHRHGRRAAAPGHEDRARLAASSLHAARRRCCSGRARGWSSRAAACARAEDDAIDLGLDTRTEA